MASYFTDEFQLSDGKTYALGAGASEPAPAFTINKAGNLWEPFTASIPNFAVISNNAETAAKNGSPWAAVWKAPYAAPSISFVVGGTPVIGEVFNLWVSVQNATGSSNGYLLSITFTSAGKCQFSLIRSTNGSTEALTGVVENAFAVGDTWTFRNNQGNIAVTRNGIQIQSINDYKYGVGKVALSSNSVNGTFLSTRSGDYSPLVIGQAQVVRSVTEIRYSNLEPEGGSYELPPCFLSNARIIPPVGTTLSLEELRAEVTPVLVAASLNGLVSQKEVQKFGNEIGVTLGAVNLVIMRDPAQYLFQGAATPFEWRNGMYVPSFKGIGVIERLELIPARKSRLVFTSHEAEIAFGLETDPVSATAVSKLFNPAINISGGKTLAFGIETVPAQADNPLALPILQRYQAYLEVLASARYRIYELGERGG